MRSALARVVGAAHIQRFAGEHDGAGGVFRRVGDADVGMLTATVVAVVDQGGFDDEDLSFWFPWGCGWRRRW
jgi:hypothetical protein